MKGIKIEKINPDFVDERGWIHNIDSSNHNNLLVLFRKRGSVSANHYHKGTDLMKNPETFVFLKGKAKLEFFDIHNRNEKNEIEVSALDKVKIYPNVFHKITALEDIVFIELQDKCSDYKDVFRLD